MRLRCYAQCRRIVKSTSEQDCRTAAVRQHAVSLKGKKRMYVGGRAVCGRSVFMGEARGVNTTQAALRSGAKLNAW